MAPAVWNTHLARNLPKACLCGVMNRPSESAAGIASYSKQCRATALEVASICKEYLKSYAFAPSNWDGDTPSGQVADVNSLDFLEQRWLHTDVEGMQGLPTAVKSQANRQPKMGRRCQAAQPERKQRLLQALRLPPKDRVAKTPDQEDSGRSRQRRRH